MDTAELIAYILAQTGRKLWDTQLSLYIKKGWLVAERQYRGDVRYYENCYTVKAADSFIRYLTSYTLTDAAKYMSKRLGWMVTTGRIKRLCEEEKVIYIGSPYRIPADDDALHILKEQLAESLDAPMPENAALSILCECRKTYTRPELARICGLSVNTIDRMWNGSRNMTAETYDKLLQLSQEGIHDE